MAKGAATPVAGDKKGKEGRAAASRKAKTVTIRLAGPEEKKAAAKANPLQLMKAFKIAEEPLTEQIIAARKLQSSDILLDITSLEAKEGLEKART